mmetsp:Transcript_7759/g.20518  ORF Transcript_7759/g.20518 Transcript_7759/m.20518 type:complete len:245 (+) Transcript_7759:1429-2163(+)
MLDHGHDSADRRGRQRANRSSRNGIDTNTIRAELGREVACRRFKSCLGNAHHVVVWHNFDSTQVGQSYYRRAFRQVRPHSVGKRKKRVGRYSCCRVPALHRRFHERPRQIVAICKCEAMHYDINLTAPLGRNALSKRFEILRLLHVEGNKECRGKWLSQAANFRFHLVTHRQVANADLCTCLLERLCDSPSNRLVVGNPSDQRLLAAKINQRCRRPCLVRRHHANGANRTRAAKRLRTMLERDV